MQNLIEMNFAIGIPTYNRMDLLLPALTEYALHDFVGVEIHVIDNGNQGLKDIIKNELKLPNVIVHTPSHNLGVAASWNKLCEYIFAKYENALIINDDVYLGYGTDVVNAAIEQNPMHFIQSHSSWSMFIMSKFIFEWIGRFDEQFYPAYYEDSDYLYRMKLNHYRHKALIYLNPKELRISSTYEKAPDFVNKAMQENKERYILKWGGLPLLETYSTPYNQ